MNCVRFVLLSILLSLDLSDVAAWGFFGHRKINEIAVYSIPKPLFGFYKYHIQYMVAHSTDPDMRRYVLDNEACKHFLDGDYYEHAVPFDTLPKQYKSAILKYTEDTIHKHGIVPWQIIIVVNHLTEAFKQKDISRILKLSADLGHYVGDCHVPLHATSNYNGQKTGQKGIHALWESRLTELYFDEFDLFVGQGVYLQQISKKVWEAFEGSFALVDSVLKIERSISKHFKESRKYTWEKRGNVMTKVYSFTFCQEYNDSLHGMVENRMRKSIELLSSLIYTAWINAGQPDLEQMPIDEPELKKPEMAIMKGREEE